MQIILLHVLLRIDSSVPQLTLRLFWVAARLQLRIRHGKHYHCEWCGGKNRSSWTTGEPQMAGKLNYINQFLPSKLYLFKFLSFMYIMEDDKRRTPYQHYNDFHAPFVIFKSAVWKDTLPMTIEYSQQRFKYYSDDTNIF